MEALIAACIQRSASSFLCTTAPPPSRRSCTTSSRSAIDGGHEIVLVNDGSADDTAEVCRGLVRTARVPITYIEHARNFGEHNAVLTGWRHARGAHIVNLDDDGQNPPAEAVRLVAACEERRTRRRVRPLRGQAAFGLAQCRQLVHESDDRLGARQAARASISRASAA